MNSMDTLLQAIRILRPELPLLLGQDYESFQAQLDQFLMQLQDDPVARPFARALILDLFYRYPPALSRLLSVIDELTGARDAIFRGAKGYPATGTGATASPTVTRYTDISCPRRVWIDTPRLTVTVGLTLEASRFSEDVQGLAVQVDQPVIVRASAPGFALLGPEEQTIAVLAEADSAPAVFFLQPQALGPTRVTFDFLQGGNPVGTASVEVEISAFPVEAGAERRPAQLLRAQPAAQPPDSKLYIAYERFQAQPALVFTLMRAGEVGRTFHPVPLSGDPQEHAEGLYRKLTRFSQRRDRRSVPADDIDRRVRTFGQNLWQELIPDELKAVYAEEREAWRDKSLLVISDEPYFPWELVWPFDLQGRWGDEAPWCITTRFSRWLRRDQHGNGHEAPPVDLSMARLACLTPGDSRLPFARQERALLRDLAQRKGLADASPAQASRPAALDLLDRGGYDWLHAATHGEFDLETPDSASAILLEDRQTLTPDDFTGPEIMGYIHRQRPAFVFNACHGGRQGWALTRLGGWANRLLSSGAGLFLAPLWAVSDAQALAFAETFYGELLAGQTAAEAVHAGRLAAQRPGDPTWLAYSLYAHPNARLERSASSR